MLFLLDFRLFCTKLDKNFDIECVSSEKVILIFLNAEILVQTENANKIVIHTFLTYTFALPRPV